MVAPVLPARTLAEAAPSRTAGARVGIHGDDLGGGQHLEATGVDQVLGATNEDDGDAVFLMGTQRAGDDLVRSEVATHRVDGDGKGEAHWCIVSHRRSSPGHVDEPCASVDFDGLTAAVPATVPAHAVGTADLAAAGAGATRRGAQDPVGGPAATALGLGCLLLGNGHRELAVVGAFGGIVNAGWGMVPGPAPRKG